MKYIQYYILKPKDDGDRYFEEIVQMALDADYAAVLEFIGKLRNEYMMRLNSHIILTAAIHHPKRVEFNRANPNAMKRVIQTASIIPTDWTTQGKLLLETGKPIPTIWKKTIAESLENMTCYHASKYIHGNKMRKTTSNPTMNIPIADKKTVLSLIDLIRITHPKSTETIGELMKTGKVTVSESEETWEKLKSKGKTWIQITNQIRLPHMALLRNLRNIVTEYEETNTDISSILEQLIQGVKNGKQFPFRYYSAYKAVQDNNISKKERKRRKYDIYESIPLSKIRIQTMEALSKCIMESLDTLPKMNGYVHCLSDNSGSARGAFVSDYGSVGIYEIANLSSLITAYTATEGGSVWGFGDSLAEYKVDKTVPILKQLEEINQLGNQVGPCTETGVWLFWEKMIQSKTPLDTVFIYSDMQAGYGHLYAESEHIESMKQLNGLCENDNVYNQQAYINVLSLVNHYRENVKHNVNLFTVQVAGYNNTILPEILYRGAVLSGWTGKESILAHEMIRLWDSVEHTS
jgi:hypothetical protein